jgi:hypothetical protein
MRVIKKVDDVQFMTVKAKEKARYGFDPRWRSFAGRNDEGSKTVSEFAADAWCDDDRVVELLISG